MFYLESELTSSSLQVAAAHACYILGGQLAAPYDTTARLCLPGVDHQVDTQRLKDTEAIHLGLLLDWAQQKGILKTNQFCGQPYYEIYPFLGYVLSASMTICKEFNVHIK